jgi:hypothetical protein
MRRGVSDRDLCVVAHIHAHDRIAHRRHCARHGRAVACFFEVLSGVGAESMAGLPHRDGRGTSGSKGASTLDAFAPNPRCTPALKTRSTSKGLRMSEHVWISHAMSDPTLIQRVDTDISESNLEVAVEGQKLNQAGKPVPADLCPKRIWGDGSAPAFNSMPDLFWAMTQWIVSRRAHDVLVNFDLGSGALHPVSGGVWQSDRSTRVPGEYFCWTFGNTKQAFLPDESRNLEPPSVPGLWWNLPSRLNDEDVAVSRAALPGPDVWLDKMLFKSLFLSGLLGDALDRAGLRKSFRLYRCRVL